MGSTLRTLQVSPNMNMKIFAVLAVTVLLSTEAAVLRRKKRSLGLVKLGVDTASGISSSVASALKAASVGAGIASGKSVALGLLGKYALYKWLTSGSNAGVTGSVGVGPFEAAASAGFGAGPLEAPVVLPGEIPQENFYEGVFWYEPIEGYDADYVPVEIDNGAYVSADGPVQTFNEPIFVEPEDESETSGLFGVQGGVSLGPLKINGGIGAGR